MLKILFNILSGSGAQTKVGRDNLQKEQIDREIVVMKDSQVSLQANR